MSYIPTKAEAEKLLSEHNREAFHIRHGQVVSGVMGYFAKEYDPERVEFWEVAGLLHDLDFEECPEEHCVKEEAWFREMDLDPEMIAKYLRHPARMPDYRKNRPHTDFVTSLRAAAYDLAPTDIDIMQALRQQGTKLSPIPE